MPKRREPYKTKAVREASPDGLPRVPFRGGRHYSDTTAVTGLRKAWISRAMRGRFPKIPLIRFKLLARSQGMSCHELAYHLRLVPEAVVHTPKPELPPRGSSGLQQRICAASGYDKGYVSRVMRRVGQPSVNFVLKLAKEWGCSMDHVIETYKW